MSVTLCPDCKSHLQDLDRCACGWMRELAGDGRRGRCDWRSHGRACTMLANSSRSPLCSWHYHWSTIAQDDRHERVEFATWLKKFRPGGDYGHNPGQWWADEDLLWECVNGLTMPPKRTEEIAVELLMRDNEYWYARRGLTPPPHYARHRLSGYPLPPWYGPELEAEAQEVRHG
ncbi:hypothetical protein [Candidatus Nitrospira bockiana]